MSGLAQDGVVDILMLFSPVFVAQDSNLKAPMFVIQRAGAMGLLPRDVVADIKTCLGTLGNQ